MFFFSPQKVVCGVCTYFILQRQKFWCAFVVVFFWLLFSFDSLVRSFSLVRSLSLFLSRSFVLSLSLVASFFLSFFYVLSLFCPDEKRKKPKRTRKSASLCLCATVGIFSQLFLSLSLNATT